MESSVHKKRGLVLIVILMGLLMVQVGYSIEGFNFGDCGISTYGCAICESNLPDYCINYCESLCGVVAGDSGSGSEESSDKPAFVSAKTEFPGAYVRAIVDCTDGERMIPEEDQQGKFLDDSYFTFEKSTGPNGAGMFFTLETLMDIYSIMEVPDTCEINSLQATAKIKLITTYSDGTSKIHTTGPDWCSDFMECTLGYDCTGLCVEMDLIDDVPELPYADFNRQFCEGVSNVGENTGTSVVEAPGNAGYGGCREDSSHGRDWPLLTSSGSEVVKYKSQYFRPKRSTFSLCCGNDEWNDMGTLAKVGSDNLVCVNDDGLEVSPVFDIQSEKDFSETSYSWKKASTEAFNVFPVNKDLLSYYFRFDVASNSEDWFVCGPDGNYFDEFTQLTDYDNIDGVRLNDSRVVPRNSKQSSWSVSEEGQDPNLGTVSPSFGETAGDSSGGSSTANTGDTYGETVNPDEVSGLFDVTSDFEQATACDKDGDGYPGNWRSYPGGDGEYNLAQLNIWQNNRNSLDIQSYVQLYDPDCQLADDGKVSTDKCCDISPDAPFDCRDWDSNVGPGMPEVCGNGVDDDCDEEIDESDCVPPIGGNSVIGEDGEQIEWDDICYDVPCSDRLMCFVQYQPAVLDPEHNFNSTYGSFADCAGYSLGFSRNDFPTARRQGSALRTLWEFSTMPGGDLSQVPDHENLAAMYAFNEPANYDSSRKLGFILYTEDSDLPFMRSFNQYGGIDFHMLFGANFVLKVAFGRYEGDEDIHSAKTDDFAWTRGIDVINFATEDVELGEWAHMKINFSKTNYADYIMNKVDAIWFYGEVIDLNDAKTHVSIKGLEGTYSNVVAVDRISLLPKDGGVNYYCGGGYPYNAWISDMDNNYESNVDSDGSFKKLGWGACEDTPGYSWTGNACCGDDNEVSFKETYLDSISSCVLGENVVEDDRFMVVGYFQNLNPVFSLCKKDNCSFGIKGNLNTLVNLYPNEYSAEFVKSQMSAEPIAFSDERYESIKVSDVPLKLLYDDGEIHSCNPPDYLYEATKETISGYRVEKLGGTFSNLNGISMDQMYLIQGSGYGDSIIDKANNEHGSCEIQGDYFCSHAEGKDIGWSGEKLFDVDSTEGNNVPATDRKYEKQGFNLITNGGFEDD